MCRLDDEGWERAQDKLGSVSMTFILFCWKQHLKVEERQLGQLG